MATGKNENWGECARCGSPVLLDPATGKAEKCAQCASKSSRWPLYLGGFALLTGAIVIVLLVIYSLQTWLGGG